MERRHETEPSRSIEFIPTACNAAAAAHVAISSGLTSRRRPPWSPRQPSTSLAIATTWPGTRRSSRSRPIDSGGVVEFDLLDASCGQLDADCGVPQLLALNFDRVDQVGGPIAVNGAEPGDTLQIDLLDFQPASWGWTAVIPGFGLLADEFPDPSYHVTRIGPERADRVHARHPAAARAVLRRDRGRARRPGRSRRSRRTCTAGTWTPATSSRARRCTCRCSSRARACPRVTATRRRATARSAARRSRRRCARRCGFRVRKDLHVTAPEFLAAPDPHAELRNGPRYATDGVGPDLLGAARDATRRMIDWLGREHGLAPAQAYMLCSVAVDLRISEIVDMPNYLVTAYCPLGIFALTTTAGNRSGGPKAARCACASRCSSELRPPRPRRRSRWSPADFACAGRNTARPRRRPRSPRSAARS